MKTSPNFEFLFEVRFKILANYNNQTQRKTVNIENDMCILNVDAIFANCVKASDIISESKTKKLFETMSKPIARNK